MGAIGSNAGDARIYFIVLNALASVGAIVLLFKLFRIPAAGPYLSTVLILAFLTEGVVKTLAFSNINGVILLTQVGFIYALMQERWLTAGISLGIAVLIKPFFGLLILIPLLLKAWKTVLACGGFFLTMTAIGQILVKDAADYYKVLVPYLKEVRPYANSSLLGMGVANDWSNVAVNLLRAATVVLALAGIVILWTVRSDYASWACAMSSLLLCTSFLVSNLGQGYYSIFLIPLFFCAASPLWNPMRSLLCCVGLFETLTFNWIVYAEYGNWGPFLSFSVPIGWALMVLGISVSGLIHIRKAAKKAPLSDAPSRPEEPSRWPRRDAGTSHRLDGAGASVYREGVRYRVSR